MPRTYAIADIITRLALSSALICACFLIGCGLMLMYIGLIGFSEFDFPQ